MVRFENVGMRYGAGPEVLRDVSFALDPGSLTFLTGPSGAGKSTFLKLVFMAERPSRGLISLFGRDLAILKRADLPPLRRRLGVVFQEFRLLDHLSAFDNVALPLRLAGHRPADYFRDVEELLSWVGLGERMHHKPATLSGGEQQRVAIARAVANDPKVLLSDEPTGNLDPHTAERVFEQLLKLVRQSGVAAVVATHNLDLAARMDRTLRLMDGILLEEEVVVAKVAEG
jgi:cell division transport system ATP-binding protein